MGIVFSKYLAFDLPWPAFYVTIGILIILSFVIGKKGYPIQFQSYTQGVIFLTIILLCGIFTTQTIDPRKQTSHIANHYESADYIQGTIVKTWRTAKSERFIMEVSAYRKNKQWHIGSGEIILTAFDTLSLSLGDEFIVKNRTKPIAKPKRKYQIDYSNYYKNQGIYLQQFLKTHDLISCQNKSDETSVWIYSQFLNQKFETNLEEGLDSLSFGVLNALVLGDKSDISSETKSKFAKGGIMHILAVSGLHVGILFLILHQFLGFLKRFKIGKPIYYIAIILTLWSYALITGWSNSVVRATLMFTIFLFAEILNKKHYPLNTTACSAFIILTFFPNALFQISFQLSYAAVFSIILFYDLFYRKVKIKHYGFNLAWKIMCVSLAAQIGTFPITLYYFHIFQPAFLIFNLIAIPAAFVFLTGGFALISLSEIEFISGFISKILNVLIFLFDRLIGYLNKLSPAFENIQINIIQVIILYLLIYYIPAFIFKKKLFTYALVVLIVGLMVGININKIHTTNTQEGIEFLSKNEWIYYNGDQYFDYSFNDNPINSRTKTQFLKYYNLHSKIDPIIHSNEKFDLILSGNKRILVVKNPKIIIPNNFNMDYIVSKTSLTVSAEKKIAELITYH